MPGAHRNGDSRSCGAATVVTGQNNVYVNGQLWAVEGDDNTHGSGPLRALHGSNNVYVGGQKAICAVGSDTVSSDDNLLHGVGEANPLGHSMNVILYGGAAGGGS